MSIAGGGDDRGVAPGALAETASRWALPAAVSVPAILYLLTLYPGVGGRFNFGDSAKFQFIGEVLGVPHEPGFPQYVLLNFLWTRLPLPGSLAWRVNLLSAVLAVLAALLFFALARRLSGSATAAVLATWGVFLGRRIWAASTDAEVYALNLAWVAAVLLLAWQWRQTRRPGLLAGMLFAYALSFGNHPSMIVLLPALVLLIAATEPARLAQPRWVAVAITAVALGLSQYGYLLWRAQSDTVYLENLPRGAGVADLVPFMFAQRFSDRFFRGGADALLFAGLGRVLAEANVQFLLPALLLAGAGAAVLWHRDAVFAAVLAVAALGYALFAAGYEIPDWEVYCLPLWLLLGWFLAAGLGQVLAAPPAKRRALLGAFLVALLAGVSFNLPAMIVPPGDAEWRTLVDAAGRNAILVTHVERAAYHAIQTDNYYRFGLGLEASRNLRFTSAEQAFYDDALYLGDTPLLVSDARAMSFFRDAAVDLIEVPGSGELDEDGFAVAPGYARTGTRDPVYTVEVVPRPGLPPALLRNGGTAITRGDPQLEASVIGCAGRRVKAVRTFDLGAGPAGLSALVELAGKVAAGDWLLISARGPIAEVDRPALAAALRAMRAGGFELASVHAALFAGARVGAPGSATVLIDAAQPVTVALECGD